MDADCPETADAPPWPRLLIGNAIVDLIDRESALSLVMNAVSARDHLAIASANLDHIYHFSRSGCPESTSAAQAAQSAGNVRWLTLLDGVPLVRTAHSLTGRSWPKLSGSDLIEPILARASSAGASVGFLGGAAETHVQLRAMLGTRYPALRLAGTWAPSRAELNSPSGGERIAAEIRATGVDILIVGLGKPRQERWIADYGAATGAAVLLAFGAVVDFVAGRVRRAPEVVTRAGGEWAWRLILEPRRLARRYLVQGPQALVRLKLHARIIESERGVDTSDQRRSPG
jgi:N-acetylglucosaminyldiphosphoundecaprenol N-acetyl-beta-D-mannosaminyltransferase